MPNWMKRWWLLGLCGVLYAIVSVIYLLGHSAHGPLLYHAWHGTVELLGKLTLVAGVCTVAAAWTPSGSRSWFLLLNGLACSALGAVLAFWTGPLSFGTVALLIVIMAISIGLYEFVSVGLARERLFGVISIGFALAFLAFVFRWVKLNPGAPNESLYLLGCYFAFSAICMLALSARLHAHCRLTSNLDQ